jgi:hypothetical protein
MILFSNLKLYQSITVSALNDHGYNSSNEEVMIYILYLILDKIN